MTVIKQLRMTLLGTAGVAVLIGLSGAVADADVAEISPTPLVTIDLPAWKGENAVRAAPDGEVQAQGVVRDCKLEAVCAQGDVRDTTEAVPGSKSAPFYLGGSGEFTFDPPMGEWTPLAP